MNRIKRLASRAPITFGLAVTLASILMVIISAVLANRWPPESQGWYFASTIGRVVAIAILLAVLSRLGWLLPAGIRQPGRWQTWLIILLPLVYSILVSTYAMSGSLDFRFSDAVLPAPVALFLLTHALFEEIVFRGLVMVAFIARWGSTTRGLIKSVLLSSLIFAGMHLVNVLSGNPLPIVFLQSLGAFFLGILFAALVLSGKAVYPAAFLHGLLNIGGYLILSANPSAGATPSAWLLQSVLMFPLAIFGVYILGGVRQRPVILGAA